MRTVTKDEVKQVSGVYERHMGVMSQIIASNIESTLAEFPPSWVEEAIVRATSGKWWEVTKLLSNWQRNGVPWAAETAVVPNDIARIIREMTGGKNG